MVIIHQFYEPFLCKKTAFFVLYPILRFFLQKSSYLHGILLKKRFLGILPGADEKTGLPPPKREAPFSSTLKTDVIPTNRTNRSRPGFLATGMMRGRQEANAPGQKKTPSLPDGKARGFWWARVDSNHRSIKQQIYSLSPLATREHALILFGRPACLAGRLVYSTTGFAVCQQLF